MTAHLTAGDVVTASLSSTGGSICTVIAADMTAEIDLKGTAGPFIRVPCVFARGRTGTEHVLVYVPFKGGHKWVGARHRSVSMFREVEDADGEHIAVSDPDLGRRMNDALQS